MNTDFQNRLFNYEVPPPEGSWDRIAAALNDGALPFNEKLYGFEQEPPSGTWNKIEASLEQQNPGKVKFIPFGQRYKRVMQYAGVAAAIIMVAFLSWPFINNPSVTNQTIDNIVTRPPTIFTKPDLSVQRPEVQEESTDQHQDKNTKTFVAASRKPKKYSASYQEQEPMAMLDHLPAASIKNDLIAFHAPVDNYMIYTDESGHPMKLPKKLFDAFECATKEIACRQKIKDLQQRVASSAVSSDFTGVLQMLRNLQENQ